jgi:hypothetical protein
MDEVQKEAKVTLIDAAAAGWPELHGSVGVVKDVTQDGQRVQVFFDGIGWLTFSADELRVVPPPRDRASS